MRFIDARTGKIKWNWNAVENAHISHLYDRGEVDLRMLTKRKAAKVVEYMAAHENINKAANACITLTDEEIELLTNYAELNGDEASYLRVLCFMLKEGLYDNCVLWLPMTRNLRAGTNDTDTEVYDRSNFGNHGTIIGAVWQTLPSGKSVLSFAGVEDYVEVQDSESLRITGDITIEAWVKPNDLSTWSTIISKINNHEFEVVSEPDGRITFYHGDGEFEFLSNISLSNSLQVGKWTHFAIVRSMSDSKVYCFVNGVDKVGGQSFSKTPTVSSASVTIGGRLGTLHHHFNGTIDEVCIYGRALSAEEIRRLYELTRVFYGV